MGKKKILILDDESPIADMIADFCEALGYQSKSLNTGEEILKVVHSYKPDLITLDILMPDMSGLEILAILKQDERSKKIPVIFISAFAGSLAVHEIMNLCQGVLAKPVRMQGLKDKIDKVLAAH